MKNIETLELIIEAGKIAQRMDEVNRRLAEVAKETQDAGGTHKKEPEENPLHVHDALDMIRTLCEVVKVNTNECGSSQAIQAANKKMIELIEKLP